MSDARGQGATDRAEGGRATSDRGRTAPSPAEGRSRVGPFALQKKLGEGPHGTTYAARRGGQRAPWALKVLATADTGAGEDDGMEPAEARLERLRADLARLGPEHPNLVIPAEAGLGQVDGKGDASLWLASELVEGPDLLRFTARASWSSILEVIVSVLRGLEALHARGLRHGHLVAANVVVAGQGPRKTARLLDPGLACELGATRGLCARPSRAPEVLRGEAADRRADLYDLGCLLFECATREPLHAPPPDADDEEAEAALVHAHLHLPPRRAREVKRSVPVAVDDLIAALLARDPSDRPPSANAVIRELNRAANKRFSTETREARLASLLAPRFVGRQAELEGLLGTARRALAPAAGAASPPGARRDAPPVLVAVTAEPGLGRTRLLHELHRALDAGGPGEVTWVAPAAPTAAALVGALLDLAGGGVPDVLPDLAPVLRALLPADADPAPDRHAPRLAPDRERERLVEALARLLVAAARGRPLVLALDDAQRADALLVDALRRVAGDLHAARSAPPAGEAPDEPSELPAPPEDAPLMVVASLAPLDLYGGPSAGALRALLGLPGARDVPLEPLDPGELAQVVASALGRDPAEARPLGERVAAAAEGAPAACLGLLAELVERGALPPPDGAWSCDEALVAPALAAPGPAAVVGRRLAALAEGAPLAARLARLLAVHEAPVDPALAAPALDASEDDVLAAARELERRDLLAPGRDDAGLRLAGVQLAEAILEATSHEARTALHDALARAALELAARGAPDLLAVAARHLERGATPARAAAPALLAARRALERHAHDEALALLEPALRALGGGPAPADALPEALRAPGSGHPALAGHLLVAEALAHEARQGRDLAQALLLLAAAHRALADAGQAKATAEEAARVARGIDWKRGVAQALHARGLAEEALGDRDEALASLEEARQVAAGLVPGHEQAALLRDLARLRGRAGDAEAAVELALRAAELDEESEVPGDLAASLRLRATLERDRGAVDRALDAARRAVLAAREALDPRGEAEALGLVAELLATQGDLDGARARAERALAAWERLGQAEGTATCRLVLGRLLARLGRGAEAERQLALAGQALKQAGRRDALAEVSVAAAMTHALRGDLARARDAADRAIEEAKAAAPSVAAEAHAVRAEVALALGELAAAEDLAGRAADLAARSGAALVEARARRALGEARWRRGRPTDGERDLRLAIELALGHGGRALAARCRLELGQVHLARGEPAAALAELERARDDAQGQQDAPLELRSLVSLGRLHRFLGQTRRALALLDMARDRARELDLGAAVPEVALVRAECLLEVGPGGGDSPEPEAQAALADAQAALDEAERHVASRRGLRAELDLARAALAWRRGDAQGGRERAEAALEAARVAGDALAQARAEAALARGRREQGRHEEAHAAAERALALAEPFRDGEVRARALLERGLAARALGRALAAAQDLREAASLARGVWASLPEDLRRGYEARPFVRAIGEAARAVADELEASVGAAEAAGAAPPAAAPAAARAAPAPAADAGEPGPAVEDGGARDAGEALKDPLTGLFNHTFFSAQLETEIKRALRHGRPLSLLKMNVDRFKLVRELYGPKVGKRVIRDVAQALLRNVRDVDIVARYFGDEFEALLPDTDQRGALLTAERIRAAVEAMRFEHEDEKIELTLTIGAAAFPRDAKDKDALVCRVDEALYNARSRGSNSVFGFGGEEAPAAASETRELDQLMLTREGRTMLSMFQRLVNQELDMDRMIELVTSMVVEATRGERGFILLKGPDGEFGFRHGRGIDDKVINSPELSISTSIAKDVARTGAPIHVSEAVEDDRFKDFKSVMDLRLRSIICAPIRDGDEVFGVIYVDHNQVARNFTQEDLNFLVAIAEKVSIPIKNSKRLREAEDKLAVAEARLQTQVAALQTKYKYDSIIGRTEAMQRVFKLLDRIVETSHSVVIHGESGTGKELIARAIHYNGARKQKPFVAENCAALSDTLLEAELFGHVKGAFTGADRDSKGLFELANGGTLFLDEIGDMSERMQKKLLRVLQEGEVRPVGGKRVFHVDVRIISASNKDLKQLVTERKFREDLYYRLNVITVNLPPLRERKDDIVALVHHFLAKHAEDGQARTIDRETVRLMVEYDWPGNVRELENEVNKLVAMSDDKIVPDMLSPKIREGQRTTAAKAGHGLAKYYNRPLKDVEFEFMKDIILYTLEETNWHRTKAAKLLRVPTSTLFNKMKKYGIG